MCALIGMKQPFVASIAMAASIGFAFAQEKTPMAADKGPGGQRHVIMGPGMAPPLFPEAKEIPAPKNGADLAAAITKLGDEVSAANRFSGAVLVAVDGKPLVEKAWGLADRERKIANTAETSFDVASLGKLFTQIAILQLAEAGKLSLDERFGEYLPDYPNRDVAGKVTLRQLLLHTSGMGDFLDALRDEAKAKSLRTLKDFVPLFANEPLAFESGSQMRYSNAGYVVLGRVIEAITGEDYYKYIESQILTPAGMKHSGFFDRSHLPPTVARSYDNGVDVTGQHAVRGSPAGGLQASAGDLLCLVQAIDAGKLLSKESIQTLREFIPHPPDAPPPSDPSRLTAYGVVGGAPGVSAQLSIDPSGRYVRIVLCNAGPPMAMSMAATIGEWVKQLPR
jgi:D-alanyl-D-alanine carboxypeptidase